MLTRMLGTHTEACQGKAGVVVNARVQVLESVCQCFVFVFVSVSVLVTRMWC